MSGKDSVFYIVIDVHLQCNDAYSIAEQIAPSRAIYCPCKTPCNDAGSLSGYRLLLCSEWYYTAYSDTVVSLDLIRFCVAGRLSTLSKRAYVICDMCPLQVSLFGGFFSSDPALFVPSLYTIRHRRIIPKAWRAVNSAFEHVHSVSSLLLLLPYWEPS